jgi:hypothetical protein
MLKLNRYWIGALFFLSVAWSIYDWSKFSVVVHRLDNFSFLLGLLAVSEILFIAGALIMALEAGRMLGYGKSWHHHLRHPRRSVAQSMQITVTSRTFGLGFWLNLTGALGTTLILISGVLWLLPIESWGLIVLLAIDIVATISWRLPLHKKRRQLQRESL